MATFAVPLPKTKASAALQPASAPVPGPAAEADATGVAACAPDDVNDTPAGNATAAADSEAVAASTPDGPAPQNGRAGGRAARPDAPPLKYEKPEGSSLPRPGLGFEVVRSGALLETLDLPDQEFVVFGRLPMCDLPMEHPSISRYHAVLQFFADGTAHIYDLGSAHGTKLNKRPIAPRSYQRLRIGDQLRFGESTRSYCFTGPPELDHLAIEARAEERRRRVLELAEEHRLEEERGVSWGMADDAEEEDEDREDGPSGTRPTFLREADQRLATTAAGGSGFLPDEDAFYRKDPKKVKTSLRNYLEHRSLPVEYETTEEGPGHARVYTSRIHLGFDDEDGPVYGTAVGSRKRETEQAAALNAMEKLDAQGLLRSDSTVPSAADMRSTRLKKLLKENEDDDDDFYDRTASASRKAKKTAKGAVTTVETFESLTTKLAEVETKVLDLTARIALSMERKKVAAERKRKMEVEEIDVDQYMSSLKEDEKIENINELRVQLRECKKEEDRLLKMRKVFRTGNDSGLPKVLEQRDKDESLRNDDVRDHEIKESEPPSVAPPSPYPLQQATFPASRSNAGTNVSPARVETSALSASRPDTGINPSPSCFVTTDPERPNKAVPPVGTNTPAGAPSAARRRVAMGPSLPPAAGRVEHAEGDDDDEDDGDEPVDPEVRRQRQIEAQVLKGGLVRTARSQSATAESARKRRRADSDRPGGAFAEERPADAVAGEVDEWVPPAGQSGDGATALNAKYGY